jgi:hypothetical protein
MIEAAAITMDGIQDPAERIFECALAQLQSPPEHCIFVGDDPRWDQAGAEGVDMEAVLIDRLGEMNQTRMRTIRRLCELLPGIRWYARCWRSSLPWEFRGQHTWLLKPGWDYDANVGGVGGRVDASRG